MDANTRSIRAEIRDLFLLGKKAGYLEREAEELNKQTGDLFGLVQSALFDIDYKFYAKLDALFPKQSPEAGEGR